MKRTLIALIAAVCLAALPSAARSETSTGHWPQWRGPLSTGAAPEAKPPLRWSEGENVRWKIDIPGRGSASPIVWGDRVFVLTAVPVPGEPATEPAATAEVAEAPGDETGRGRRRRPRGVQPSGALEFTVLALSRRDGSILWQRVARSEVPHEGTHQDGTWASNSPTTDGERLYAYFGSQGLYAYSLDGELLWQRDFGDMQTRLGFGEGSSPALHGDTLVVNWDHEGPSFLVALDAGTGEERWRVDREEITSWSTPLVVEAGGGPQVVVNATGRVRGYDLKTGEVVWETGGMTVNTIPSPVAADGIVYVTSGFRGNALKAIRLATARGVLDGTEAILWEHDRDTPYVPSPLLYGGALYILKHNSGILTAFDAASGETLYGPERLDKVQNVYASPVAAAGRVYVVGRDGHTVVLRHGKALEVLAVNSLEDRFDASPAIVDSEIFLRGHDHLYALAEEAASASGP